MLPLFKRLIFPFSNLFFKVDNESTLYCGHFLRHISAIIDLVILAVILNIASKFLVIILPTENLFALKMRMDISEADIAALKKTFFIFILLQLFILIGLVSMIVWGWHKWGKSPGKFILGIKLVDKKTFQNITYSQAIKRLAVIPFSILPFLLGFIWIAFDKKGQAWHDKIANTIVIRK